jgi:hypothetical protein
LSDFLQNGHEPELWHPGHDGLLNPVEQKLGDFGTIIAENGKALPGCKTVFNARCKHYRIELPREMCPAEYRQAETAVSAVDDAAFETLHTFLVGNEGLACELHDVVVRALTGWRSSFRYDDVRGTYVQAPQG